MPVVVRFTVRFEARFSASERAELRAGMAAWEGSGAVELVEGEPWRTLPAPPAEGCSSEILVAWASPDDPVLRGELAEAVGVGVVSCGVRYAAIVHGRVSRADLARVAAHELGHAMGIEHVDQGVMTRTLRFVEPRATCDDWAAFCAVYPCPSDPCP